MCGIIISTKHIPVESHKKVKYRGPDKKHMVTHHGINFVHFLLSLTGNETIQPIVIDNIVYIFNGEIYNYRDVYSDENSDVYAIEKFYKLYGEEFVRYIDGEFTILIFDFNKNKFIMCSDTFKTKPLFYIIDHEEITISSYKSSCKIISPDKWCKSIEVNTCYVFSLDGHRTLLNKYPIHTFNLSQIKDTYDDYFIELENSILKRYPEKHIPLVLLSSGLDSGSIACCLNKYNKKAIYVSFGKNEDMNILKKRKEILGNQHIIIELTSQDKQKYRKILDERCEKGDWDWSYNPVHNGRIDSFFTAGSMLAKCKAMEISDTRVTYSGIGADEVMSHNSYYSLGYGNVNTFPEDLETVFPWPNLFGGSMKNYLRSEEYVGGAYGYETRYPYTDHKLVQEFLSLKNNLKNGGVKPALVHYLNKNNFPHSGNIKKGFDV